MFGQWSLSKPVAFLTRLTLASRTNHLFSVSSDNALQGIADRWSSIPGSPPEDSTTQVTLRLPVSSMIFLTTAEVGLWEGAEIQISMSTYPKSRSSDQ